MIRSARERVIQTLAYEAGGLLLASPLYGLVFGTSAAESFALMAALSVAVMTWSPIHNTLFDYAEWRIARRVASDRPHRLRLVHAASHEATALIVSLPVIMLIGGHPFAEALALDIGLTLFYSAYAYFFHIAFDWLRPVPVEVLDVRQGLEPVGEAETVVAFPPPIFRDDDNGRIMQAATERFGIHLMVDGYDAAPERLADRMLVQRSWMSCLPA
ncbi:MAG: PACE efflux transporter [Rhizobiales bacterium]|nr:PACE efflux transporter [Hyphomicrobiales bacterium]